MKNTKKILIISFILFLFFLFIYFNFLSNKKLIGSFSGYTHDLTAQEVEGLLLMREEEKLARDVYLTLSKKWNLPIFQNISNSEQRHMDMVKSLLVKYNLTDPVKDNSIGSFSSDKFSNLYLELIEQGDKSLLDALKVGDTIEDLDIKDLQDLQSKTDNQDIKELYVNLMKGSRNHLRSYVSQIEFRGGTYFPQYISRDYFNFILDSPRERGFTTN